jgi:hypothetical protein
MTVAGEQSPGKGDTVMSHFRVSLLLLAPLLGFAAPLHADMGPKPDDRLFFSVTYAGEPLPDTHFTATVLRFYPTGSTRKSGPSGAAVPGLADLDLSAPGGRWGRTSHWGGEGARGHVEFNGFYEGGGVPDQIRLAVYLPSQGKVFVSDVAETHPLLRTYQVDLQPDGTATLRLDRTGAFAVDWLVGLWRLGMWLALGLTLAIESLVVAIFARRDKRPVARLFWCCLAGNLLTLPIVWAVTVTGFCFLGPRWGFVVLAIAELFALLFEGLVYAWRGRLGWAKGFRLSFLANAASLGVGIISGQASVWVATSA